LRSYFAFFTGRLKPLFIHPDKIDKYLLSLSHKNGASKANFFRARGFHGDAAHRLPRVLMAHYETATLVSENVDIGVIRRVFECNISCPDGSSPCIRTVWGEYSSEPHIRLLTAYPKRKRSSA
jgi:hypothetical protein